MNDHVSPKRTVLGFLKFAYWTQPKSVFGNWALLFLYFIPLCFTLYWYQAEQLRLITPPRFDELYKVEGTADFRYRDYRLIVTLPNAVQFFPICRGASSYLSACTYDQATKDKYQGAKVVTWNHAVAKTLQVVLGGMVVERHSFDILSEEVMDTRAIDRLKIYLLGCLGSILLGLPLMASFKFFRKQN